MAVQVLTMLAAQGRQAAAVQVHRGLVQFQQPQAQEILVQALAVHQLTVQAQQAVRALS